MRNSWVASRKGKNNVSQMHFARKGEITEEMVYVAKRENLPETLVMEGCARSDGYPANINHSNLEPMAMVLLLNVRLMQILALRLMQVILVKN